MDLILLFITTIPLTLVDIVLTKSQFLSLWWSHTIKTKIRSLIHICYYVFSLFLILIVDFYITQCWIFLSSQLREVWNFPLPAASPFPLMFKGSLGSWWVWGSVLVLKFRSWGVCFCEIHFSSAMNPVRQGIFQADPYEALQHKPHFTHNSPPTGTVLFTLGLKILRIYSYYL